MGRAGVVAVSREVELKLELPIAAAARLLERSFNRLEGNQGIKQHLVSNGGAFSCRIHFLKDKEDGIAIGCKKVAVSN